MAESILFAVVVIGVPCFVSGFVFYVVGFGRGWEAGFERGKVGERKNQGI